MKTFVYSTVFTIIIGAVIVFVTNPKTVAQSARPTRLARYQISAYISADSTTLRVAVNKELGGQVYVHLIDLKGSVLFAQTMMPLDTMIRLRLNLADFKEGKYTLKVSNGLDSMVREFKTITRKPVKAVRSITLVQ